MTDPLANLTAKPGRVGYDHRKQFVFVLLASVFMTATVVATLQFLGL